MKLSHRMLLLKALTKTEAFPDLGLAYKTDDGVKCLWCFDAMFGDENGDGYDYNIEVCLSDYYPNQQTLSDSLPLKESTTCCLCDTNLLTLAQMAHDARIWNIQEDAEVTQQVREIKRFDTLIDIINATVKDGAQ